MTNFAFYDESFAYQPQLAIPELRRELRRVSDFN